MSEKLTPLQELVEQSYEDSGSHSDYQPNNNSSSSSQSFSLTISDDIGKLKLQEREKISLLKLLNTKIGS